jgi:stage II sporulation protein D
MNSEDVWLSQAGYLRSVSDTYEVGGRVWTRNFTNDSLTKVASANGYGIGTVKNVTVEYHTYGPVKSLTLIGDKGSKTIEKDAVRTMFSSSSEGSLLSVNFKLIKNDDGSYTFDGKGYGHGVGMSQYGAKGMAEQGYTYDAILKHYYTGVTIE